LIKRQKYLPFAVPHIDDKDIEEVTKALKSGWISSGPRKQEFEKRFSEYIGVRFAVAMNSCTAAMHTALVAKGIGEGDEVITTPFTFCSTVNVILHAGAKPVLVDIDPKTYCINPKLIEQAITEKTKAVIPVHYGGQPCDMDAILKICKEHNLFCLEDAAHAVNAEYKGKKIGSFGDAAAFSFYATKNLTTSEGGMLVTNDEQLYEKASILSLHGLNRDAWKRYDREGSWYYEVEYPGYKYNMTDIQAALGLSQLEKINWLQKIRDKYVLMCNEAFGSLKEIVTPIETQNTKNSWHLYPIRINSECARISRNKFIEELAKLNIGTSVHFIPIHYHPYYKTILPNKKGDFPAAEKVYEEIVSLPLYPSMKVEDVEYVIEAVKHVLIEGKA